MPEPDTELRAAWTNLALTTYPEAAQLRELVTGNSREEIMASAADVAERVKAIAGGTDDTFERARQAYGPGPTTGGGFGSVPSPFAGDRDAQRIRRENQFAEKFNNAPRDAYGQRLGISPAETTEYTSSRFVNHVRNALSYWATMTRSDAWARNRSQR